MVVLGNDEYKIYNEFIYFGKNNYNNIFFDDNFFSKILSEYFNTYLDVNNGYDLIWLNLIAIGALFSGIFVIITKNPVLAVLYLISLFMWISGYLFLIGLSFIGLSYLLVYVGAVSILFLFILMLINIRISELQSSTYNSLFLSFFISVAFYSSLLNVIPSNYNSLNWIMDFIFKNESYFEVNNVVSDKWDGNLISITDISSMGNIIYSSHSIWLIITSIILLLAMIGCIVMTVESGGRITRVNTIMPSFINRPSSSPQKKNYLKSSILVNPNSVFFSKIISPQMRCLSVLLLSNNGIRIFLLKNRSIS